MALEKAPEGEVLEAEEGEEEDDVGGFDDDGPDADVGNLRHAHEEGGGKEYIGTDGLEVVGNGVLLLADEIGEKHAGGIATESCPCTGDVAVAGYEDDIDCQQYQTSDDREQGTPQCLVAELVPEGEVEVDAHHDFGSHDDGDDDETFPIVLVADEQHLEDVEPCDDAKEAEEGEDDEILHAKDVGLDGIVLVFRLIEDDGLVGITERLREHCHNHGNLGCGSVDAKLAYTFGTRDEEGVDDLVHGLVEDAGNAEDEHGITIFEHAAEELTVPYVAEG